MQYGNVECVVTNGFLSRSNIFMKEQFYTAAVTKPKMGRDVDGSSVIIFRIWITPAFKDANGRVQVDKSQQPMALDFDFPAFADGTEFLEALNAVREIAGEFQNYIEELRHKQLEQAKTRKIIPFPTTRRKQ